MSKREDLLDNVNPELAEGAARLQGRTQPGSAAAGARFQFERQGYFCLDPDTQPGSLVFNRTVELRDTWAKDRSEVRERVGALSRRPLFTLHKMGVIKDD